MSRRIVLGLGLFWGCGTTIDVEQSPVRASLQDGQVLQGLVSTTTVALRTELGTHQIPVGDIGELEPLEGNVMSSAHNRVKVWLRNGSELVGEWADPELTFHIDIDNALVPVRLPIGEMQRFQLRDGETWPTEGAFAVTTSYGDDFIVNPRETKVTLSNTMGTFSPTLAEIQSIAPLAEYDKDWRIALVNGNVLIGTLPENEIQFSLPKGPKHITVPLDHIVSVNRNGWNDMLWKDPGSSRALSPSQWFDNSRYRDTKSKAKETLLPES